MGTPAGWKNFTSAMLSAVEVNDYLMSQSVMVFATAAARTSGLGTPNEGNLTFLKDSNSFWYYDGSSWINMGNAMPFASSAARSSAIPTPVEGMITWLSDTDELQVYNGSSWLTCVVTSDDENITTTGTIKASAFNAGANNVLGTVQVGDSSISNSDGSIVIGKNNGAGGNRHFKIGYDSSFNIGIGDYGFGGTAGTWNKTIKMSYDALDSAITVNSSGHITFPYQPAVHAIASADETVSFAKMTFNATLVNRGSHFNTLTSTFTCPVAGLYFVHAQVLTQNNTSATDMRIVKNGSVLDNYAGYSVNAGAINSHKQGHMQGIVSCNASDSLYIYAWGTINKYGNPVGHTSLVIYLLG